jgi:hypothetical protein
MKIFYTLQICGNTGVGLISLDSNLASYNTGIGARAGQNVTSGSNGVFVGYNTGLGITTGSYNTVLGAGVSGLAAALTDNIILATGQGTIRLQFDGTDWTFQGNTYLSGQAARTIALVRHTTANTAGNSLTIQAGGATASATDKAGGNLLLKPGISTGTGTSSIELYASPAGSTGTADNTLTKYATLSSTGLVLHGTAKYDRHLQLPLSAAFIVGSSYAVYAGVVYGNIVNSNSDTFYIQTELFSDWDGSDCYLEIDWLPTTALALNETVIWVLEWRSIAEGEDADTGTTATTTVTYTAPGAVSAGTTIHSRATLPATTGNQPLASGDHIYFKMYRDATTDTWAGDCLCTAFEFIYTSQSFPVG